MDVKDFLPKYPSIHDSKYEVLNPYDEDFYEAIFQKKEFYENRLERVEEFPRERGLLTKHQQTIARYMSSYTTYDRLLLFHAPGTGKTCSTLGAIEQVKEENSTITGAIVIAKSKNLLDNWIKELAEKCTAGQYIPENYKRLTHLEKIHRTKKLTKFYQMRTIQRFAKSLKKMSDKDITNAYSNRFIVIDEVHNLRVQTDKDKESVETYKQYHRLLHLVKNCKVLLLTGTPMKDGPEEIASIMNLLLPLDKQLPYDKEFLEEYMDFENNVYKLKKNKRAELMNLFKGYVSFLRETQSTVRKEYLGQLGYENLKHFTVLPLKMKKMQRNAYDQAFENDKTMRTGVYNQSREATLFVYPDGSYGSKGFKKYIQLHKKKRFNKDTQVSVYRMSDELKKALKGNTQEETLENIRKHSVAYATVIEQILNTDGNCFIYCWFVRGSGAILFGQLLNLFGYSKANGKEVSRAPRYGLLTNETATPREFRNINERFNRKDNMKGEYIQVIIGSKAVSEGFSFKNVVFEAILTPHWNYSETAQALARGIRLGSHNDLRQAGINPVVKIVQPVSIPKDPQKSIDLLRYETSEDKDISIRNIIRLLMEVSFDCALNYFRNHVKNGVAGSRECDYTTCDYKCTGINMSAVKDGLNNEDLDYSTYQLFYANPKTPLIRRKIETLFRNNLKIDLDSIIENLKDEFTEDEVKNALYTIQEETEEKRFDYRVFLELYTRSPVKKIVNRVEEMFKGHFRLDLNTLLEQFPNSTEFEVLTGLRTMINENIVIKNKYGFPSYLREENNTYFLVNNLTIRSDFFSGYYTQNPHIHFDRNFSDIMTEVYQQSLPILVDNICQTDDEKEFVKLMKALPLEIQEMMVESSLIAKDKKIKYNKAKRKQILKFFESYIRKVNGTWISTLLGKEKSILRCKQENEEVWENCDEKYTELIQEVEQKHKEELRTKNPYGVVGLFNPETKQFCIIDTKKEKTTQKTSQKGDADTRRLHSGKVCGAGGWKLPELMEIAIKRVKIKPPVGFMDNVGRKTLLAKIKESEKLGMILTEKEVEEYSDADLRRALYWGTKKPVGNMGIKPICNAIQETLRKEGLLEIDNQCGVRGKRKKQATGEKKTQRQISLKIEELIPANDEDRVKELAPQITKLMDECFGIKKYRVPIANDRWVLAFSRKKLVGFVTVDKKNVLWNVCVAKGYRRIGIAKTAIEQITKEACRWDGKNPSLFVKNTDKNYKKLIRMYKSFGFDVTSDDGEFTYMIYKC